MPYLSATFGDSHGRTTKRLIEIETQVLLADYLAVATAYKTEIQPLTDLGLLRLQVIIDAPDAFAITDPSNVDVGATFAGRTDSTPPHVATTKVPGLKDALADAQGNVPLTQADVAAYLALFTVAGGEQMISDGEHIVTWIKGTLDK